MKIRIATDKDYALLQAIEESAAARFVDHGLVEMMNMSAMTEEDYLALPDTASLFVAEQGGEIVGFALIKQMDGQPYLDEIDVRYDLQGKGIGSSLIRHVLDWAMTQGADAITLTTFRDLPFNAPFYARFGFQEFIPDTAWPELAATCEKEKKKRFKAFPPRIAMKRDL